VQSPLPQDESSRLESLTDLRIPDTSPEQVFDDVARLAALICDTPIAVIDFVNTPDVQWIPGSIGRLARSLLGAPFKRTKDCSPK
jgi:hypothetical protein